MTPTDSDLASAVEFLSTVPSHYHWHGGKGGWRSTNEHGVGNGVRGGSLAECIVATARARGWARPTVSHAAAEQEVIRAALARDKCRGIVPDDVDLALDNACEALRAIRAAQ